MILPNALKKWLRIHPIDSDVQNISLDHNETTYKIQMGSPDLKEGEFKIVQPYVPCDRLPEPDEAKIIIKGLYEQLIFALVEQ